MGEIQPKTCEGRELTKDQLVLAGSGRAGAPHLAASTDVVGVLAKVLVDRAVGARQQMRAAATGCHVLEICRRRGALGRGEGRGSWWGQKMGRGSRS